MDETCITHGGGETGEEGEMQDPLLAIEDVYMQNREM
jgi:hypothetical protein